MIDFTRLLPKILRADGRNVELAVKLAWSRAAGAGLQRHAIPIRLDGKTLVVTVADAIWQKQLQHMSSELIYRINTLVAGNVVDSLLFRIDPAAVRDVASRKRRDLPKAGSAPAPTELLFAAGSIKDEELRARFIRAAQNCIARREVRNEDIN